MRTGSDLIVNDELILSGNVILDDYVGWMWEEDVFFSPSMVRAALNELGDGRVTVRINSGGGHADAGEQIRATLAGHPGGCRIIVEGIAASAASLILMSGAERLMSAGSHIMIHDPSGAIWGNEDEARRHADQLGVIATTYATVYAAASGKSPEEARAIMKAEMWFGPEAAIAEGFADGLVDAAPAIPAAATLDAAKAACMDGGRLLLDRMQASNDPNFSSAAARGKQRKEGVMPKETRLPRRKPPRRLQAARPPRCRLLRPLRPTPLLRGGLRRSRRKCPPCRQQMLSAPNGRGCGRSAKWHRPLSGLAV
ncbi:Clp protease ClpP [Paracoccus sp. DMF-8]|uniref:head maturation protease, ClpP-related n=1 Tax=Paracoccus sp. DMF-8 TaxID=3019445 RepID=UPI0023E843F5|nr:head maturation protease, ClpP-related [Paracoccus sp. DMF-8]MDF3606122.1 Clp protease ClpP [Paracoccus sp. DMF-8]